MNFFYLPWWYFRSRLLGQKRPLQTVLFISDLCNLKCKHCAVYAREKATIKSYDQIKSELEKAHKRGSRFVDFEGGEPFLWNEDGKTVNELCNLAIEIGFFTTTITTNAQKPFTDSTAHSIWVSMDGLGATHDEIRGEGAFKNLEENIKSSAHKHLSVNMVINTHNYKEIRAVAEYARKSPYIEQVAFNFHTPYVGTESLYIEDIELRRSLIDEIINLKKQSYPIMNSISGLKRMKDMNFTKYCWVSEFIMADGTYLPECPGKTEGICDKCGFCMAGEMYSIMRFKPDTLLSGLKLRL